MSLIILAVVAMLAQDVLSVCLTQAEARNRAHLAGMLDAAMWFCWLITASNALTFWHSENVWLKWGGVLAVTAANYVGSYTGTKIGEHLIKTEDTPES